MITQGIDNISAIYASSKTLSTQRQNTVTSAANFADKVSISYSAKAKAAEESVASTEELAIQKRLDAIKAKPAVERTSEESEFLRAKDKVLAEITAKDPKTLTSSEIDYIEKAGGFVNFMSALSDKEKAMYDEMVSKGSWEAAQGMFKVAMSRLGSEGQITLPNGKSFDPNKTEITAANIRNLFRHTFVDSSGITDRQFDALASFLDARESAAPKA